LSQLKLREEPSQEHNSICDSADMTPVNVIGENAEMVVRQSGQLFQQSVELSLPADECAHL
jgi:hypothetical protein